MVSTTPSLLLPWYSWQYFFAVPVFHVIPSLRKQSIIIAWKNQHFGQKNTVMYVGNVLKLPSKSLAQGYRQFQKKWQYFANPEFAGVLFKFVHAKNNTVTMKPKVPSLQNPHWICFFFGYDSTARHTWHDNIFCAKGWENYCHPLKNAVTQKYRQLKENTVTPQKRYRHPWNTRVFHASKLVWKRLTTNDPR